MLLLILGVGLWGANHWLGRSSFSVGALASSPLAQKIFPGLAAKAANKPEVKKQVAEVRSTKVKVRRSNSSAASADLALPYDPSVTTVLVPSSYYPAVGDLKPGSKGTEIIARFGEPSARVAGVRDGDLFERYYYLNHERTEMTVATLSNGILVSAQSMLR